MAYYPEDQSQDVSGSLPLALALAEQRAGERNGLRFSPQQGSGLPLASGEQNNPALPRPDVNMDVTAYLHNPATIAAMNGNGPLTPDVIQMMAAQGYDPIQTASGINYGPGYEQPSAGSQPVPSWMNDQTYQGGGAGGAGGSPLQPPVSPEQMAPITSPNQPYLDMIRDRYARDVNNPFYTLQSRLQGIDPYAGAAKYGNELETRRQAGQTLQIEGMKAIGTAMKEFDAMQPEMQQQAAPFLRQLINQTGRAAGFTIDPSLVETAIKNPLTVGHRLSEMFGDKFLQEHPDFQAQGNAILMRARTTRDYKTASEDLNVLGTRIAGQVMTPLIPDFAAQYRKDRGLAPDADVPAGDLYTAALRDPTVRQSPYLQAALKTALSDKEMLASLHIVPGAVPLTAMEAGEKKRAEVAAEGPKLGDNVNAVLATYTDSSGRPLTTATAMTLRPGDVVKDSTGNSIVIKTSGSEIVQAVSDKIFNRELQKSRELGLATEERKLDRPIAESHPGSLFIDTGTHQEVPAWQTTGKDLRGGKVSVKEFKGPQIPQWTSLQSMKGQIHDMRSFVDKGLTDEPGANLGQAAQSAVLSFFGVPNIGTALDAYKGTAIQWVKAISGSSRITNNEMAAVEALMPTTRDTKEQAQLKMTLWERQRQNLENRMLNSGSVSQKDLDAELESAVQELRDAQKNGRQRQGAVKTETNRQPPKFTTYGGAYRPLGPQP